MPGAVHGLTFSRTLLWFGLPFHAFNASATLENPYAASSMPVAVYVPPETCGPAALPDAFSFSQLMFDAHVPA